VQLWVSLAPQLPEVKIGKHCFLSRSGLLHQKCHLAVSFLLGAWFSQGYIVNFPRPALDLGREVKSISSFWVHVQLCCCIRLHSDLINLSKKILNAPFHPSLLLMLNGLYAPILVAY
jgi:hypothetical protein